MLNGSLMDIFPSEVSSLILISLDNGLSTTALGNQFQRCKDPATCKFALPAVQSCFPFSWFSFHYLQIRYLTKWIIRECSNQTLSRAEEENCKPVKWDFFFFMNEKHVFPGSLGSKWVPYCYFASHHEQEERTWQDGNRVGGQGGYVNLYFLLMTTAKGLLHKLQLQHGRCWSAVLFMLFV